MVEILLIRHGETNWNAERRLQGHLDIPLNIQGEQQAAALGRALREETLDAIVSSDMQRALQTAEVIAASRGMKIDVNPGLRERCFGAFEGLRYSEIRERYPDDYAAWQTLDVDARFPSGTHMAETLREFSERAISTVMRLVTGADDRKIAVVTHGGVLECVYRAAKGIGFSHRRDVPILNGSINRVALNGKSLEVIQWGDVAHLTQPSLDEAD